MNILFLSTRSPYPLISGHSLRTYHILEGAAQKHSVTLITFIQLEDELKRKNLDHLRSFCKAVHAFTVPADMSKVRLATSLLVNLFSPLPFVAKKYEAPMMRRKIGEVICREDIDLVHVDMLPLTIYINEFDHLPKILVNHNVESIRLYRWYQTETNIIKKAYLGFQWLKLKSFERSAMSKFDDCVVVSEVDKALLAQIGITKRLTVVPNGTDIHFFEPRRGRAGDKSVLWIGHMDVHTNRDAVLYFWERIYPILRKRCPEITVTFVGTSPPKQIANAAEGDNHVMVTGFVDDIRPHVANAAVVVVPIRIGSGTRLKILDAMAMGKAVVSTSIGCEGIDVTDGRNILIADKPDEFADGVLNLLSSTKMRRHLEKHARELAKKYDWNLITEKQELVYQNVITRRYS